MFGEVNITGDPIHLRTKEIDGKYTEYDCVPATIGKREVNVYYRIDPETKKHDGTVIVDKSTRAFTALFAGKDGFYDQMKTNAPTREMTPLQAGQEHLSVKTYQVLNESSLSRFSRATSAKISNGWTSVKNGASWVRAKTGSGITSTKEFYGNHPVAFKRAFLSTACAVTSIVSYYIQLSFNPIGMMQNAYYGTPNNHFTGK